MAQKVMLKNAMKEMAAGSKKAFHTFYTGTAQYVYQSAYYLYANERSAREFMVDFYQYLYLHLPEYTQDQSLENWISALVRQRFRELSIGKKIPDATLQQRMTTVELDKNTRNQIWHMLEMRISFPPEKVRLPYGLIAILLSLAALLLLFGYHYKDVLFPATQNNLNASDLTPDTQADEDASEEGEETEPDPSTSDSGKTDDATAEDTSDEDDLTDKRNGHFQASTNDDTPVSDSDTQDSDDTTSKEADQPSSDAYQDALVHSKRDTTTPTVEQPTVNRPENNSTQDQTESPSTTERLDDFDFDSDIDLHYGDSLTDRGSLNEYE